MVRVRCNSKTDEYFCDGVENVALKCGDNFCEGYVAKIIGDCAFAPFGDFLEIYEADEWWYADEEEEND